MFGRKKGRCEETHEYVPFLFTVSLSRWLLSVACPGDQSPGQTAWVSHMPGEALLFLPVARGAQCAGGLESVMNAGALGPKINALSQRRKDRRGWTERQTRERDGEMETGGRESKEGERRQETDRSTQALRQTDREANGHKAGRGRDGRTAGQRGRDVRTPHRSGRCLDTVCSPFPLCPTSRAACPRARPLSC